MVKYMMNDKAKIGILMLNTSFPRVKGDIGNIETFDFKVIRRVVNEANSANVVKNDSDLLELFIEAAQGLEKEGVRAITTSCGFLIKYQNEISSCLQIPFFSSSLLMLKYIAMIQDKKRMIGILTARKATLLEEYFEKLGMENVNKVIYGMDGTYFSEVYVDNRRDLDFVRATSDLVSVCKTMIDENPEIGAIVLECTNMSPYIDALRAITSVPIFDICSLVNYMNESL